MKLLELNRCHGNAPGHPCIGGATPETNKSIRRREKLAHIAQMALISKSAPPLTPGVKGRLKRLVAGILTKSDHLIERIKEMSPDEVAHFMIAAIEVAELVQPLVIHEAAAVPKTRKPSLDALIATALKEALPPGSDYDGDMNGEPDAHEQAFRRKKKRQKPTLEAMVADAVDARLARHGVTEAWSDAARLAAVAARRARAGSNTGVQKAVTTQTAKATAAPVRPAPAPAPPPPVKGRRRVISPVKPAPPVKRAPTKGVPFKPTSKVPPAAGKPAPKGGAKPPAQTGKEAPEERPGDHELEDARTAMGPGAERDALDAGYAQQKAAGYTGNRAQYLHDQYTKYKTEGEGNSTASTWLSGDTMTRLDAIYKPKPKPKVRESIDAAINSAVASRLRAYRA